MTAVEARVSDAGIGFSTPEGLPGVVNTGDWDRPEQLLSTAKQNAHDHCLLDTPEGRWLSERQVISAVSKHTQAFVGETPEGPQVFLVAPSIRSRYGNEGEVPMSVALAREYAIDRAYLRAVRDAAAQQLIGREEAVRQAGGTDPADALDALEEARRASADARSVWNLSKNQPTLQPREALPPIDQDQDSVRELALAAARATQVAIPAGMAGVGVALAGARRRDEHGRRFRTVGSVVYRTAAAIAVGSMAISACTSVQTLRPPQTVEVTVTPPMPDQFSPQFDQAKPAVALWVGMRVPLAEGEFGIFPNQAIFEADPTDSTGQTLKTLSLLNPDGRTTDPNLRYAMGLALIPSEKTGEAVELPFLVQLGKNGEALMLGMFLDQAQSTEDAGVFRLNIIKGDRIRPVTQDVVVTKVAGGVTIELRDISDSKNIVTYHLVSTPKDASFPSQQSVVPSEGADNKWIEKVVAFMSGAGRVQAAEPATPPEELATATSILSETSSPTATPTETPTEKPPTPKPPTKEPTIVPTQQAPTEVAPTLAPAPTSTIEPPPPPVGGYNWHKEGNQWICEKCPWNDSLIYGPNITQVFLSAGDSTTRSITYSSGNLSQSQFLAEVERLKKEGYQVMTANLYQAENIGDPAVVGIKPQAVWFYMQR